MPDRNYGIPLTDAERAQQHFDQYDTYDLPPRGTGLDGIGQSESAWQKVTDYISANPWSAIAITLAAVGLWIQWRGTSDITKAIRGG